MAAPPPTRGKVRFRTTAGDWDVELWSDQAKQTCRRFLARCARGRFQNAVVERVVKKRFVQIVPHGPAGECKPWQVLLPGREPPWKTTVQPSHERKLTSVLQRLTVENCSKRRLERRRIGPSAMHDSWCACARVDDVQLCWKKKEVLERKLRRKSCTAVCGSIVEESLQSLNHWTKTMK